ncbi:MAG: hypothetical protein C0618_08280 [Desulfuromonas sp.]|nr:MAG: hypothetical protein C0618_08280 [Desulfuromonas sp.]
MERRALKPTLLCALVCFLLFPGVVLAQDVLSLLVPPTIWIHGEGDTMSGVPVEVIREALGDEPVLLKAVELPWARAMGNMASGALDVMPVIFYTEERTRTMEFSHPYVDIPTVIVVPKGKAFPYERLEDLVGRRGLVVRGDSIDGDFDAFRSQLDLIEVNNYQSIFKMLDAGRADYAVAAKYAVLVESLAHGYQDQIEELPVPVAQRQLHIAISKRSKFLPYLPKINAVITRWRSDGRLAHKVEQTLRRAAAAD